MTPYRALIVSVARGHSLDPNLVEAVVIAESNGCTDAFRFEPAFFDRYLKGKPEYTGQNPRRVSSSYGLLQVMYSTAQQYGFSDHPEALFFPEQGLQYGCLHLAHLLRQHGDARTALAAYNAGNPDYPAGQKYAARVLKLYDAVTIAHPREGVA